MHNSCFSGEQHNPGVLRTAMSATRPCRLPCIAVIQEPGVEQSTA